MLKHLEVKYMLYGNVVQIASLTNPKQEQCGEVGESLALE